ncbi:MAG: 30S ribosomal protein S2 [Candidatus Levybacteria bacterium RIFCSPHIGHO2_02_FULL_40_18]|nr:MAG: 30S ribosomal protein S2 [Candidatus Levybacteria bacterium RIFCSPHIGHO2_01_FULL_40_58]OGH26680.1 MAG: 30S ribosomal protein S2 [Candidatus Levybacteria bacterium RIFCSPHIGHO2_02_FULL_40_18]OGH31615.1 MAG: 30S ribosomal protein S2 [Candidatus Levybacteria bacterium RIFCSPHIGHO2_12_FULL_40_31]OGH40243.1 MAG: 30S ribosomal protein S2 [Candidatus Levybacteria bacterium RIFCSPLOWO2_01_FULL_40_64]OGH49483.1 MAG: 30S ribosomal protein S2 [Candidatus Levybacteria bacterium RIFCSPLOWO2_02_FULL_
MHEITLEELLEAGCHFGHQVNRRNPKADIFIFEARSNIHIINLEKTREGLVAAGKYLLDLSSKGGYIVFVGTKRQAKEIVKEEVGRAKSLSAKGIFYVTSRWVGGTLTNFSEVAKNFKRLSQLNEFIQNPQQEYTKREIVLFTRERDKLKNLYEGISEMDRIPDALVIIGTQHETTAVREAIKNDMTTVGIVDTNADPTVIEYPIPANDDAVGSIKLITSYLVDAWIEGADRASAPAKGEGARPRGERDSGGKESKDTTGTKSTKGE